MNSPNSLRTVATPPTVIRSADNSEFYAHFVSLAWRISFCPTISTLNKQMPDVGTFTSATSCCLETGWFQCDANSPTKDHNPSVKRRKNFKITACNNSYRTFAFSPKNGSSSVPNCNSQLSSTVHFKLLTNCST